MSLRLAIAVSAFALLGACATAPVDVTPVERGSNLITPEKAETLLARGYYDQAAAAYRKSLESDATNVSARHGLAEAERLGGKLDAAAEDYRKLMEIPEWKLRAVEGLARIDFAKGDRAAAMEKFSAVVKEDQWAWKSWLAIAQLSDLSGDWTKADEAYGMALAATKEPAAVYNNHGVSLLARGHAGAAADLFRKALAADPKIIQAKTNFDLAEARAGKKATLEAAGNDARERARTLNNYGYVAMLQGRPEDAKRYYEAALKEHPSFYALAYNNLMATQGASEKADKSRR
ncbi:MAG TPA: tetratricopeptide repeat protein [Hyphomonadaceae bacterium]